MCRNSGSLRVFLLRSLILVGFIGFLLVAIQARGGSKATTTTTPTGSFKHLEQIGTYSSAVHPDLDPNYMSKRRVPNGPDPIHNRKAGNSNQPPGRA